MNQNHTPESFTTAKRTEDAVSIGREAAKDLFDAEWWLNKSPREIASFQLSTQELCCHFGVFHEAVEKTLGRPVFTHEFGLNYQGLLDELNGAKEPATMQEVMDQIPAEKRIVVQL